MTGDVVLLNSCLASGACVDITVRDGVIHEIGDTEATGGTPKSDRENAAIDPLIDFRSSPNRRHSASMTGFGAIWFDLGPGGEGVALPRRCASRVPWPLWSLQFLKIFLGPGQKIWRRDPDPQSGGRGCRSSCSIGRRGGGRAHVAISAPEPPTYGAGDTSRPPLRAAWPCVSGPGGRRSCRSGPWCWPRSC